MDPQTLEASRQSGYQGAKTSCPRGLRLIHRWSSLVDTSQFRGFQTAFSFLSQERSDIFQNGAWPPPRRRRTSPFWSWKLPTAVSTLEIFTPRSEPPPSPTHRPGGQLMKASALVQGKRIWEKDVCLKFTKNREPRSGRGNLSTHLKSHFPGRTF